MAKIHIENRMLQKVITSVEKVAILELNKEELGFIYTAVQLSTFSWPNRIDFKKYIESILEPKIREM